MTVYIVIKWDATGLHICKVFLNRESAEAYQGYTEDICKYDASFEIREETVF